MAMETAIFSAGCFWGVEAAFRKVKGVVSTMAGYTGGHTADPTYEQVCTGTTGHAESVEVTYDPSNVSYDDLLTAFWRIHDPTTRNRQGPDVGSQYRSAIFYRNLQQREAAQQSKRQQEQSRRDSRTIVTELVQAMPFYKAEEYHQRYLEKHGQASCHL